MESSHYYESRGSARGTKVSSNYNNQYEKSVEDETEEIIERINTDTIGLDWKRFEKQVMYQAVWDDKKDGLIGEPTTLISDKSRVYKGGSWRDRAFWMNGGTRRFLDEDRCMASLGFRCAMTRVGSPQGLGKKRRK